MLFRSLVVAVLFTLRFAGTAAADPIQTFFDVHVTAGAVSITPGTGSECCRDPEQGPGATGSFTGVPAVALSFAALAFGVPCDSGCASGSAVGALSIAANTTEGVVEAPGQAGPIEFSRFGGSSNAGGGSMEFIVPGSFVLPMTAAGSAVFEAPFSFNGDLVAPGFLPPATPDGDPSQVPLQFAFSGSGTARISFAAHQSESGPRFFFDGATFTLANPTPEPASLLLLASGLGVLMTRRQLALRRR